MTPTCGSAGTAGDGYRTHPQDTPMAHHPADCDQTHDPLDDVSITRPLTPALTEVLDLLVELPHTRGRARASRHDWRRVDAVAARLAQARATTAIPAPRPATETRPCAT